MTALVVDHVSLRFGGIRALEDFSLTVDSGQICGLIGPNGAGKTTLFNCVSRIYQPTSGSITLGNSDLLRLPAHRISAHGVGRTFQNLGLFSSLTFLENVMAGGYPHGRTGYIRAITRWGADREDRALKRSSYELLKLFGLAGLAFSPAAGQPFGTLKRLELARALAAKPSLLLLDEPAGGLTHGEVAELSRLIRAIPAAFGVTVLLVEHHMAMVMSVSDKVVAMGSGRKIAEGSPEDIRRHPEVVAAYLGDGG